MQRTLKHFFENRFRRIGFGYLLIDRLQRGNNILRQRYLELLPIFWLARITVASLTPLAEASSDTDR